MKVRHYIAFFWVGDDHDEFHFYSEGRKGSKKNLEDLKYQLRRTAGKYIADRAEIENIQLVPEY